MKHWIINNFWIKVISLILAVITWFYVRGELNKEKRISSKFYHSASNNIVIPAEAGIQKERDSRFRGNDTFSNNTEKIKCLNLA
jgi:YbbR domain-containing protein